MTKTKLVWILLNASIAVASWSCGGPKMNTQIPSWEGKVWVGDSGSSSIKRNQENAAIACNAEAFQGYLCMSPDDFQSFYKTFVLSCRNWKVKNMSTLGAQLKINADAGELLMKRNRKATRASDSDSLD